MVLMLANESFIKASSQMTPVLRLDGRVAIECRKLQLEYGPLNGQSEVHIGNTIVRSGVCAEVVPPLPDRPNDGRFFFNLEISDQREPNTTDGPRSFIETTAICNYVERVLRGSKAIDTESLCILGGKSVWSIRIDIHVVSNDGGMMDACCIAALAALLNFKRATVNVVGDSATVFSFLNREPVHLSLHHLPISTSFAAFHNKGEVSWIVDPSLEEEQALQSCFSIACNQHGEMCGFHKPGGLPFGEDIMNDCLQVAVNRARDVSDMIRKVFGQ